MPAPMTPPRTPSPMPSLAIIAETKTLRQRCSEPVAKTIVADSAIVADSTTEQTTLQCARQSPEDILQDPLCYAAANQWSPRQTLHVRVVTSGYSLMDLEIGSEVTTVTISVDASPESLRRTMVYIVERLQNDQQLQLTRYYNFQLIGRNMHFVRFIKHLEHLTKMSCC